MYNNWGLYPTNLIFPGVLAGWLSVLLIPIAIWSVFWMGWALWRAAKADSKAWFIILLLVHTVGILDIIYIFLISKKAGRKGKK
jgi:methionyl-tRNA synthetase